MSRKDNASRRVGLAAAMLGVVAGVAEIVAGTVAWAGNKNDPTTLGWVTIGLGLLVGSATLVADRTLRPSAQLGSVATLLLCAVLGLTTAGLAWIPAAAGATAASALITRQARPAGAWQAAIRTQWASALVVVLALIYLAFGVVARDLVGLLGISGAGLVFAALAMRYRSPRAAAVALVVAAVPFAAATAWTVVTPLTVVLMLAIGLPHVLGGRAAISSAGGTL